VGVGHVDRAAIGAVISSLNAVDLERLGLGDLRGALVRQVSEGGPGSRAGLLTDDVIESFDGRSIDSPWALRWAMSLAGVGNVVKLGVRRASGRREEIRVRLGDASEMPEAPEP
jgi:serine protease Do